MSVFDSQNQKLKYQIISLPFEVMIKIIVPKGTHTFYIH